MQKKKPKQFMICIPGETHVVLYIEILLGLYIKLLNS